MEEEYNALMKNRTWTLVDLPAERKPVGNRWIYKVKRNSDGSTLLILIYVDDIIVTGSNREEIEKFITVLNNSFSLKDLGQLNYFLGIEVKTTAEGLHLSQKRYIKGLLIKSKMDNAKPLPTPMVSSLKLTASDGDPITNATEYRSIVGVL
ncbi:hypothetical protein UlMin_038943 [Ulmus minor]